jgi:hypothetical protein
MTLHFRCGDCAVLAGSVPLAAVNLALVYIGWETEP